MADIEKENENLRHALAEALKVIHHFFGLTEGEMKAALDDAATNPDFSPHDHDRWSKIAYPKTETAT
jgi:hypothetical protein